MYILGLPFLHTQALLSSAKAEVKEAVKFSLEGSELEPPHLYNDVYSDQAAKGLYIRGCDPFTSNQTQAQP